MHLNGIVKLVWEDLPLPLARCELGYIADLSFPIDNIGVMTLVWTSVVQSAQPLTPRGMVLHHLALEKLPLTRYTSQAAGVVV